MVKQRSSIQGRDEEILPGEPSPVETEPRRADGALAEEEPPETVSLLDEEELERALYEEAWDGVSDLSEEDEPPAVLEDAPPTLEIEQASLEEAVAAEEPPEPVAETPAPETSDGTGSVPLPKLTDMFSEFWDVEELQAPKEEVEPPELPDQEPTEEERGGER